jgi:hypothetical protein
MTTDIRDERTAIALYQPSALNWTEEKGKSCSYGRRQEYKPD